MYQLQRLGKSYVSLQPYYGTVKVYLSSDEQSLVDQLYRIIEQVVEESEVAGDINYIVDNYIKMAEVEV